MPHIIFHAFVANKFSKHRGFLFGSFFPDCFDIMRIKQKKALLFTKNLSKNKKFVKFYYGVKLHFLIDDLLHPTYIKKKANQLQKKIQTT